MKRISICITLLALMISAEASSVEPSLQRVRYAKVRLESRDLNSSLLVSGLVSNEFVSSHIETVRTKVNLLPESEIDCNAAICKVTGFEVLPDRTVVGLYSVEFQQKGSLNLIEVVRLGRLDAEGSLKFDLIPSYAKLEVLWVQRTHTWFEKLMGEKDYSHGRVQISHAQTALK